MSLDSKMEFTTMGKFTRHIMHTSVKVFVSFAMLDVQDLRVDLDG